MIHKPSPPNDPPLKSADITIRDSPTPIEGIMYVLMAAAFGLSVALLLGSIA